MTNTHPTNQPPATPNHLTMLIAAVMDSIESVQPPPLSSEPGFEEYLNNQALLQQLLLAQHHKVGLEVNPSDQAAVAGLQKALALVERSRTRTTRPTKNDPLSGSKLRESPLHEEACEFLKAELLPGPRRVEDIFSRARILGITPITLRRAKIALNIASNLHVMPDRERYWSWSLPEHAHFADHNPPQPRPKCTLTDEEFATLKAENDAYYATQPLVCDDLGRPARSFLSAQSASSSSLGTQNSALSTSSPVTTSAEPAFLAQNQKMIR